MILKATEVRLKPKARAVLEARIRAPTTEQRDVLRAQIVLLAAKGNSIRSIAREVGPMPRTASHWRCLCVPIPDSCSAAKSALFDHLVGECEQLIRHGKAERLRRLEID